MTESRKILAKFKKTPDGKPTPITNKNLDEHREEVLKEGKKFKYPLQYSRHKVLINTVLIVLVALALFVAIFAWALYREQWRGGFFYTVSRVTAVPVARVDGKAVKYSDYLLRLRGDLYYLDAGGSEVDMQGKGGAEYIEYLKRQELTEAEKLALAEQIARAEGISVSHDEVNKFIDQQVATTDASLSLKSFEKTVLNDLYGWSLADFRKIVRDSLLKNKVAAAIDTEAKEQVERLRTTAQADPSGFSELVKQSSDDENTRGQGGATETQISDKNSDPQGILAAVQKLQKDEISPIITGSDGFYLVKLIDKTTTTLKYAVLKVAFREFDRRFTELKQAGKIKEYITVFEVE